MGLSIDVEVDLDQQAVVVRVAGALTAEANEPLRALVRCLVDAPVEALVIDVARAPFVHGRERGMAETLVTNANGCRVVVCNASRALPRWYGGGTGTPSEQLHWHVRRGLPDHWADVVRRVTVVDGCRCCNRPRRRRASRTSCGYGGGNARIRNDCRSVTSVSSSNELPAVLA